MWHIDRTQGMFAGWINSKPSCQPLMINLTDKETEVWSLDQHGQPHPGARGRISAPPELGNQNRRFYKTPRLSAWRWRRLETVPAEGGCPTLRFTKGHGSCLRLKGRVMC